MSDNSNTGGDKPQLFNRFQAFGATLRQSAQEVAAKAAAQVNEINAKVTETVQQQQQQQQPLTSISSTPLGQSPSLQQVEQEDATAMTMTDALTNTTTPKSNTTATTTTNTNSTSTTTTTAVEQKDLMELLQKMSHKVKTLTAIRQQLTEQVATLTNEQRQIQSFIAEEIVLPNKMTTGSSAGTSTNATSEPTNGDTSSPSQLLPQLQTAWQQQEEQHQQSVQVLQKEFHKMQQEMQQQQPATNNDATDATQQQQQQWEMEKQELIQKHEEVVLQLKQQLHDAISPNHDNTTTTSSSSGSGSEMELQRIKAEAATELQQFKEKVATARRAELQKVKTDTATMAKKIMETKLLDQKLLFEQQIQQLQLQQQQQQQQVPVEQLPTTTTPTMLEQQLQTTIDTMTNESNDKLEMLRQEYEMRAEQDRIQQQGDAQVRLQQAIETTNSMAAMEMEQLRTTFETTIQSLQGQVDQLNTQYDTARNVGMTSQLEIEQLKSSLSIAEQQLLQLAVDATSSADPNSTSRNVPSDEINTGLETMKHDMEQMAHIRDEALFKVMDLQNEIQRLNEMKQTELQTVQEQCDSLTKELTVTTTSLQADHTKSLNELTKKLKEKEVELVQSNSLVTETSNRLANQTSLYDELQSKFDTLQERGTMDSDQTKSEMTRIVTENQLLQNQIEQLVTAQSEATKSLEMKQQECDEMKTSRQTTESTIVTLQGELRTAQEQLENVSRSTSQEQSTEEIEALYQSKLQAAEEKYTVAMEQRKTDHGLAIQQLKEDYDSRTVRKEVMDALQQTTESLREQMDTAQKAFEVEKATMQKAMERHIDTLTIQFKERLESARTKNIEDVNALQTSIQEKDGKLKQLIDKLTSLTATSTKLRDENVAIKKKLESEMNVQKELRGQLSSVKKQLDETVANSSATASSLLQQQEALEKDKSSLTNQMKRLRSELQAKSNKVEELSGKLQALSENLNAITKGQKAMDEKLEQASKQEAKLQGSEMEVTDLREQINKLKLETTKYVTAIEKLQAEKDASERNHGQRTAIVGMLETQLSEMNDKYSDVNAKLEAAMYDLNQKSDVIQSDADRIATLEKELNEAKVTTKRTAESLATAQRSNDTKSNKMIETLQKELQSTKQQMVRKSAAAQQLLQQRESECAELRKSNQALQNEVDKGSYSDRRIFELAAKQSSRESYQVSEIEVRDSIIDRLKEALLDRDGDLASAEKHAHEVESQIEELFRIRRREDVNIDYLKSIVVQYLSLPPGSTERAGLLPVLATLLQFDQKDYRIIEDGKNKVSWWGSSVVPKLINAPATNNDVETTNGAQTTSSRPALSGSAEVSISSTAMATTATRTSLQF